MADISVFKLLGLPEQFGVSEALVEQAWKRAIALVHPDRFANRSAAERRVAEQWASRINDAKAVILDPVQRAGVLLSAQGVGLDSETDTRMDPQFLMQQFAWRERAQEAQGDTVATEALRAEIDAECGRLMKLLEQAIDTDRNWIGARESARRLLFLQKLSSDIAA